MYGLKQGPIFKKRQKTNHQYHPFLKSFKTSRICFKVKYCSKIFFSFWCNWKCYTKIVKCFKLLKSIRQFPNKALASSQPPYPFQLYAVTILPSLPFPSPNPQTPTTITYLPIHYSGPNHYGLPLIHGHTAMTIVISYQSILSSLSSATTIVCPLSMVDL